MESYLVNEVEPRSYGLVFKNGFVLLWDNFYDKGLKIKERIEYFSGYETSNGEDFEIWAYPYPIIFRWIEIFDKNNKLLIKIHFPKSESQKDEFKNLIAYYILSELDLLNDKESANKIIRKIFIRG